MAPRDEIEGRVASLEKTVAIHEAVCAERYKSLATALETQNRKQDYIIAGLGLILTAVLSGQPLVTFLRGLGAN
jgi:hypothetical protein